MLTGQKITYEPLMTSCSLGPVVAFLTQRIHSPSTLKNSPTIMLRENPIILLSTTCMLAFWDSHCVRKSVSPLFTEVFLGFFLASL